MYYIDNKMKNNGHTFIFPSYTCHSNFNELFHLYCSDTNSLTFHPTRISICLLEISKYPVMIMIMIMIMISISKHKLH